MLEYQLDESQLNQALATKGLKSLSQLSSQFSLNRATLYNYLQGKGPISQAYYQLCEVLDVDPLSLLRPKSGRSSLPYIEEIQPLLEDLARYHPRIAVGLIGSRAKGTAKLYADWDLVVTGGITKLSTSEYLALKRIVSDLSEDLPRCVDLVNLDQAPLWFLQAIDYQPLLLKGDQESWNYFLGLLEGTQRNG